MEASCKDIIIKKNQILAEYSRIKALEGQGMFPIQGIGTRDERAKQLDL